MARSVARRRFAAISLALFGSTLLRLRPLAAEEGAKKQWLQCGTEGRKGIWGYQIKGIAECQLYARPAARKIPGAQFFEKPNEAGSFNIWLRPDPAQTLIRPSFPGDKHPAPWEAGELRYAILVDGKEVWSTNQQSDAWGVSLKPRTSDILAAMRVGKLLQTSISSRQYKLLMMLDYPLDGFAAAEQEWLTTKAKLEAALAAGAECVKGDDDCFFTTAACGMVGLADDCFELTMLRRLRDERLARTPGGRAEIALYYELAPGIVAFLRRQPDARLRLVRLYLFVILPCAVLVRAGLLGAAHRLYSAAFARLRAAVPAARPAA